MSGRIVADSGLFVHAHRPRSEVEVGLTWALLFSVFLALFIGTVRSALGRLKCCGKGWGCSKRLRSFFVDPSVSDGMNAVVKQRLTELKMSVMQTCMKLICLGMLKGDLDVLVSLAHGSFHMNTVPAAEIVALLFQVFCAVPFVRAAWLPPKLLDPVFLVMMLFPTLLLTPLTCCTEQGASSAFASNAILVVVVNVVKGLGSWRDLLLVSLANLVFTGCWSYTWWTVYHMVDDLNAMAERTLVWLLLTASVMLLSALLEAGSRKLLLQGLQLAEIEERHNAATALLRSSYDVVVELDPKGCVEGASQDLGSLLLRADRKMQGVQLADLIVDDGDRATFQRRLDAPRPTTLGLAESMHLSMKDSLGNAVRVEMMWFACERADGATRHTIGIREFSDLAQPTADAVCVVPLACNFPPGPGADALTGLETLEVQEGSSSEEAESLDMQLDLDTGPAMAVIDLTAEGHPIRATTTGFRAKLGHISRNAPLSRLVKRPESMVAWMERVVNAAVNGEPTEEDHRVSLRTPAGKASALCKLALTEDEDLPVDTERTVVLFYNITRKTTRSLGPHGAKASSGSQPRGTPTKASNSSRSFQLASL